MRFYPAEPDIATIYNRILDGDIDLQPDFQRGEVWSIPKQQRLIDSILRGWVIPPILVIPNETGNIQQVLDGQQRLAAVRDFKQDRFKIDGEIEPKNEFIQSLNSLLYSELPLNIVKQIDKTTIRIYEVKEFQPDEPAEIFFRLNQPTSLTSAEKRNAFFGPVRNQIRKLASQFASYPEIGQIIGFTNSRMAFDDILSRFACSLEFNTLQRKVTAASVDDMYRRKEPISIHIYKTIHDTINEFHSILNSQLQNRAEKNRFKLNKATAHSWLLFISGQFLHQHQSYMAGFFEIFESIRNGHSQNEISALENFPTGTDNLRIASLISIYNDRATSRVADTASVILRDFTLWACWRIYSKSINIEIDSSKTQIIDSVLTKNWGNVFGELDEYTILQFLEQSNWGGAL